MIKQFYIYHYASQPVVVITNTVFDNVDSILVAPVKVKGSSPTISKLQIDVDINGQRFYIDLLNLAAVSKRLLKTESSQNLNTYRVEIKSGIDLLINCF